MVEEEEKSRPRTKAGDIGLIGIPEETNVAYDMAEERYIGTMGRGVEQDTLPTCGNRTTKDKAKIPVADSESGVRRTRARQLVTPCRIPMYNDRIHTVLFECPSSGHLCK